MKVPRPPGQDKELVVREVVSNVERAGAVLLPGAEADIVYPCYDSGPMLSLIKSTRAVFTTLPDPEM